MAVSNHVFSAFSFMSFILVSIPLPWHLQARNTSTCLYIVWVALSNLACFINSVMWDGNVVNRAPIWCDISGRVILASNMAIPATCLCIQLRIYEVLVRPLTIDTTSQKRRRLIWDLMIGLVFPLLTLVAEYFAQANRYDVLEDVGCRITFNETALAVALVPGLRLVPCLISGFYGCLNMYHIWTKQRQVETILSSWTGGPSYQYYIRLFMLSGIDMLITIPFNLWYFKMWFPVVPWPGWKTTQSEWSHIILMPAVSWRSYSPFVVSAELPRWMSVGYGFLFFFLFGVGAEARNRYASAWKSVSKKFRGETEVSPETPRHASVHIVFASNHLSATDKSESLGPSLVINRSVIAPSTASDSDPKQGAESEFARSGDSPKSSPVSLQLHTMHIPSAQTPSDPPALVNSEGRLEV